MNQKKQLPSRYDELLLGYFSSQSYSYLFAGIFFIIRYAEIMGLFIIGCIFCGVSTILLLAPLHDKFHTLACKLDMWFKGGLFTASASILIIDGLLGSLRTDIGEKLFYILLSWLFILVITNAIVISRRIGLAKFLIFGFAGFGLLMIFTGHHEPAYYIISIVSLALSIPLLDSILYKKLNAK